MANHLMGIQFGVSTSESYDSQKMKIDQEHSATYLVWMDDEEAREPSVALVSGLPAIGAISAINLGARCIGREFKERGPHVWEVVAKFSTNYQTEPSEEDPWDRDPIWSWSTENIDEPMLYDAQDNTKAIQNSAREPMTPPTRPIAVPVLTITRYEQAFDPDVILDYVNHVNSGTFWGAAAGQAWMAGIAADQEKIEDTTVWKVTYTIKFNMDANGWKMKLLDQGTYYWSGTVGSSNKTPFGDSALQQVVGNLNGSGGKNDTSTPAFVEYNRYPEVDFATLSLGPWV